MVIPHCPDLVSSQLNHTCVTLQLCNTVWKHSWNPETPHSAVQLVLFVVLKRSETLPSTLYIFFFLAQPPHLSELPWLDIPQGARCVSPFVEALFFMCVEDCMCVRLCLPSESTIRALTHARSGSHTNTHAHTKKRWFLAYGDNWAAA